MTKWSTFMTTHELITNVSVITSVHHSLVVRSKI